MNLLSAPIFGSKHLIGLLLVTLAITLFLLFFNKQNKITHKKMFLYLTIIFYILEFTKLGYLIIKNGEFPMNHLPFHLCSIPLYLYPILAFSKSNSRIEKFVTPASYSAVFFAALAALMYPSTIIGDNISWFPLSENFLPILSFTFHGIMIYASFYLIKSAFYKPKLMDIFPAFAVTLLLVFFAIIVNFLLDADFMLLNRGSGSPLVFLRDQSPILYTSSMIFSGLLVITIIFLITVAIQSFKKTLTRK